MRYHIELHPDEHRTTLELLACCWSGGDLTWEDPGGAVLRYLGADEIWAAGYVTVTTA